jgi:hypothetical protein
MPTTTESDKPKGLRFEVYEEEPRVWAWSLVGKDGAVAVSAEYFSTEKEARSDISENRGRLKAAGTAKVYTV